MGCFDLTRLGCLFGGLCIGGAFEGSRYGVAGLVVGGVAGVGVGYLVSFVLVLLVAALLFGISWVAAKLGSLWERTRQKPDSAPDGPTWPPPPKGPRPPAA